MAAELSSALLLLHDIRADQCEVSLVPGVNTHVQHGYRGYWAPSVLAGVASWLGPGFRMSWQALAVVNDMMVALVERLCQVGVVGVGGVTGGGGGHAHCSGGQREHGVITHMQTGYRSYWALSVLAGVAAWLGPGFKMSWQALAVVNDIMVALVERLCQLVLGVACNLASSVWKFMLFVLLDPEYPSGVNKMGCCGGWWVGVAPVKVGAW